MTLDEGIETMRKCIQELKTRFIINQPTFVAKIVTKEGIRVIDL
jgi:20S proteasome subunit beta 4